MKRWDGYLNLYFQNSRNKGILLNPDVNGYLSTEDDIQYWRSFRSHENGSVPKGKKGGGPEIVYVLSPQNGSLTTIPGKPILFFLLFLIVVMALRVVKVTLKGKKKESKSAILMWVVLWRRVVRTAVVIGPLGEGQEPESSNPYHPHIVTR